MQLLASFRTKTSDIQRFRLGEEPKSSSKQAGKKATIANGGITRQKAAKTRDANNTGCASKEFPVRKFPRECRGTGRMNSQLHEMDLVGGENPVGYHKMRARSLNRPVPM